MIVTPANTFLTVCGLCFNCFVIYKGMKNAHEIGMELEYKRLEKEHEQRKPEPEPEQQPHAIEPKKKRNAPIIERVTDQAPADGDIIGIDNFTPFIIVPQETPAEKSRRERRERALIAAYSDIDTLTPLLKALEREREILQADIASYTDDLKITRKLNSKLLTVCSKIYSAQKKLEKAHYTVDNS